MEFKRGNLEDFLRSKKRSVLFVHSAKAVEQIDLYKKYLDNGLCLIIPTSVDALFVLDKLKLPYKIPENYCDSDEHYNYIKGIEFKVINFTKIIDEKLYKFYPQIKQLGLELAFYNIYSFVRLYSPLADSYFKIKQIIKKEKPEQIGIISTKNKDVDTNAKLKESMLWEAKKNIFKKVLQVYQINLPIYSFTLNADEPGVDKFFGKNWKNRFKEWFQRRPRLYYFLKTFKEDKWRAFIIFLNQFRLSPLLLLNGGYNWDLCNKELYKKGYYIWGQLNDNLENWLQNKDTNPELSEKILSNLEESHSFRKIFTEEYIDFYPIFKNKISLFLEKVVPASLNAFQKVNRLIKRKKIKGLLFSINPTAVSKSIAFAVQELGLPVIGWQHGDMNYKPPYFMVFNDLLICDIFFSWGEGSNKNRQKVADELKLKRKQKNIGSASIDKLISSPVLDQSKVLAKISIKNITRPIIVYATTMYYLSNIYNFYSPPWSDNYIYNTQKKIIGLIAELGGIKIIKLHPNLFYALPALDNFCKSFKKQNVWPVRNKILAPLLFSIADAIIIDSPSTTLLQAIACKKPIFCLTQHMKLEDKAIEMLKKRVVLSEDPDQLIKELELFLESGKYKADLENGEFLENYGTNPDCRSAERAVAFIDELIKEKYVSKKNY